MMSAYGRPSASRVLRLSWMSLGSRQALLRGLRRLTLTLRSLTATPQDSRRGIKANGSGFAVRLALRLSGVKAKGPPELRSDRDVSGGIPCSEAGGPLAVRSRLVGACQ